MLIGELRRRRIIVPVLPVLGVGEAAETNGDAVIDSDIAMCNTYNPRISIIRSASTKCQSFRSAERLLDRGALKGVFVVLIEQRIAVIAGTNGIAGQIGQRGDAF
jgi:hypothetical protein